MENNTGCPGDCISDVVSVTKHNDKLNDGSVANNGAKACRLEQRWN